MEINHWNVISNIEIIREIYQHLLVRGVTFSSWAPMENLSEVPHLILESSNVHRVPLRHQYPWCDCYLWFLYIYTMPPNCPGSSRTASDSRVFPLLKGGLRHVPGIPGLVLLFNCMRFLCPATYSCRPQAGSGLRSTSSWEQCRSVST